MSDPNDVIKNYKIEVEEEKKKEFTPTPGSYMDRVDKAGGIEKYEEAKKFLEEIEKVKPENWKRLTETLKTVKGFLDLDTGVFNVMKEEITSSVELKTEELLSPLKNEINEAMIDTILNPIIEWLTPAINDLTVFLSENMVGIGIGGLVGSLLQWLPGGSLWVILGAAIGAIIETTWERIAAGETNDSMAGGGATDEARERQELARWLEMGGTLEEWERMYPRRRRSKIHYYGHHRGVDE